MFKSFTKVFALIAFMAFAQGAFAQVFWSYDFADSTASLTDWVSGGTPAGAVWEWSNNPSLLTFGSEPDFGSTSAANGFMVFDSDGLGEVDHAVTLTSPVLNCSGQSTVFLKFQNQYAYYTAGSLAELGTSTDGVNFTYQEILANVVQNSLTDAVQTVVVQVPEFANQATCYVRFRWTGNYEYAWKIDDVELLASDPTPANNLKISSYFFPPSSYASPVSQIQTDTFGFSAGISNIGVATQNNIVLKVVVTDDSNVILHQDSTIIPELASGVTDSTFAMTNLWAPELGTGVYHINYSLYVPGVSDADPADNATSENFLVTDNLFSKEDGATTAYRPGGAAADWYVANYYLMGHGYSEQYKATRAFFQAGSNATEIAIADVHASLLLLKVHDDILTDWSNWDNNSFNNGQYDIVGVAEYDYPDTAANYDDTWVNIENFDGGFGVPLDQSGRYLLVASWAGANNVVFHAFSEEIDYYQISTAVYTDRWYLGGFGTAPAAVLRLEISLVSKTDDVPLADKVMNISPNPATDHINAAFDFDHAIDATVTLADMTGKVISIDDLKQVTQTNREYNTSKLANGSYLIRVSTKEGSKTKTFVVAR